MYFDNIKLYLEDKETGRLKATFVCKKCGKEMEEPHHTSIPCSYGGLAEYHRAVFMCDECYKKQKEIKTFVVDEFILQQYKEENK